MNDYHIANSFSAGNDESERLALEECARRQRVGERVSVLIIPAGQCRLACKFARLGASVTVGDRPEARDEVEKCACAAELGEQIRFTPCDLTALPAEPPGQPYDIIVLRRGLCHIPYEPARGIIHQLLQQLKIGGKLYITVLGLYSELGDGYAARDLPVEERLAPLAPALVEKYGIDLPVCLYTERNLFMLLLEAGGSVLRTMTTTYGNVKGVAVRI